MKRQEIDSRRAYPANRLLRLYYRLRQDGLIKAELRALRVAPQSPPGALIMLCDIGCSISRLPREQQEAVAARWRAWIGLEDLLIDAAACRRKADEMRSRAIRCPRSARERASLLDLATQLERRAGALQASADRLRSRIRSKLERRVAYKRGMVAVSEELHRRGLLGEAALPVMTDAERAALLRIIDEILDAEGRLDLDEPVELTR